MTKKIKNIILQISLKIAIEYEISLHRKFQNYAEIILKNKNKVGSLKRPYFRCMVQQSYSNQTVLDCHRTYT